ncbi:hypothetical protein [Halocatena salina]|uniref:Uncharacterized protein n=1 Tax=Halocatena salina TaxID=2934340 RepID=A0A8U0A1C3_9EURY|nr:hypothetical protein [Halocatena salina]UPM42940.1 hypothetical protein MW046_00445 [Halocatena salina]
MKQCTRRTVLRHGSAVGATAISAGCLSGLSPFSNGGATYTDWLYAPEKDGTDDRYPIVMFKPEVLKEHEQHLSDSLHGLRSSGSELFESLQFESIESILNVAYNGVIQGSHTKSDVVSKTTGRGYVEQGTYNGYTILTQPQRAPIAVSDNTLLYSSTSKDILKKIINAKNGEIDRYGDQNEAFATLSDHLSGDIVWSGVRPEYPLYSPLAQIDGRAISIDGETSTLRRVYVLGSDGENASRVKGNVRSNASSGVSFSREGNVLLAEMTKPTKEIDVSHVYSGV